jgi:response regulator RpfG family c-di-GMP phosphodiesterase
MYFFNVWTSLASVLALTQYAAATLRVTADHHSFGGVNFPDLQFLEPAKRDEAIRALVKADARVIRLFSESSRSSSRRKLLTSLL